MTDEEIRKYFYNEFNVYRQRPGGVVQLTLPRQYDSSGPFIVGLGFVIGTEIETKKRAVSLAQSMDISALYIEAELADSGYRATYKIRTYFRAGCAGRIFKAILYYSQPVSILNERAAEYDNATLEERVFVAIEQPELAPYLKKDNHEEL